MRRRTDRGIALIVAIMAMLLLTVLTASVVLTTSSEALIASSFRASHQAFYAAAAAAEWLVADLSAPAADWTAVASGSQRSTFADGAPSGTRILADGRRIDLTAIAAGNPGWQLYAYGPFQELLPLSAERSGFYIIALAAPDGARSDRLRVRAAAFGPRGAYKMVGMAIARGASGTQVDAWEIVP